VETCHFQNTVKFGFDLLNVLTDPNNQCGCRL